MKDKNLLQKQIFEYIQRVSFYSKFLENLNYYPQAQQSHQLAISLLVSVKSMLDLLPAVQEQFENTHLSLSEIAYKDRLVILDNISIGVYLPSGTPVWEFVNYANGFGYIFNDFFGTWYPWLLKKYEFSFLERIEDPKTFLSKSPSFWVENHLDKMSIIIEFLEYLSKQGEKNEQLTNG